MTQISNSQRPVFGNEAGRVDTPDWVSDAVFYQIFPDRFAKSDKLLKPSNLEPWDSDPTTFGYKGGDLLGVVEHLDYIQDLGCTALYLNPIFQSACNHRYHTHDYYKVDPLLGGDEAFDTLLAECKKRGIRVVLDGVFNHASRGFFQFNDVLENGAASPWIDWFYFNEHPANAYDHNRPPGYTAWVGLHALPKLNTDNEQMREYLMRVGEYWLEKGIDGWRLDVAAEITTPGFWEEFRERMRAVNPECYIVAEIWHIDQKWLQGDKFDALMNYPFTSAAIAFCGRDRVVKEEQETRGYDPYPGIDGNAYADKIDTLLGSYDWNVQRVQMNLLDSHDTARAITLFGGDKRSLELAAVLQFTFPGAPSIYYGSEIGIDGGIIGSDAMARKTMPWDREATWDKELLEEFRTLASIRKDYDCLRDGTYQSLASTPGSYAMLRTCDADSAVVAINTSDSADTLTLPELGTANLLYVIGEAPVIEATGDGTRVNIPARSAAIWSVVRG